MNEFEKIEKKQKRSTINDALIAANLGEYTVTTHNPPQPQINLIDPPTAYHNDNRSSPVFYNPPTNYQVPNNFMPYNSLNSNNSNPQNTQISPNPLYNFFQKAVEKQPNSNFPDKELNIAEQSTLPEQNLNLNKKKTRWGPTQTANSQIVNAGTKINNVTLNINNNTNININPYSNPNNQSLMTQQMKPFSGYQNPNMMGFQPNRNPNNMMNFPIFNPMMSQNKPKPMNIFPFNHMNNMNTAYQRFKMAEVNKNIDNNEDRIKNILEGVDAPVILHDYLSRAYQKCINLADKNQMDKFLKKIINLARIQNEIHVRDWKNHPLPALPRERMEINQDNVFNFEIEETDEPIKILNKFGKNKMQVLSRINKQNNNSVLKLTKNMKIIQKIKKNNLLQQNPNEVSQEEEDKRNQRRTRFHKELAAPILVIKKNGGNPITHNEKDEEEFDFEILCDKWKIKGICTDLEKPYLRLTSEPDPSQVRPEKILKSSMKMLLNKWKEGSVKYNYISEQFRSIRQDLIIQHIRNDFTVKIYENNARICLECHDINQFNQCQGKLYELYKDGIKGNKYEFLCYRMIYLILNNQKYEINRLLNELSEEDLKQKNILLALEFQTSMEMGNVMKVFNFYKSAPNLSQYLIDLFINKLRIWGLQIISKGYGERIDVSFLTNYLAFNDQVHCINFLEETQAVLTEDKESLLLRESHKIFLDHPIMRETSYKAKK